METTYYAVCNANGPISVKLEGNSLDEALASWQTLNAREAIDEGRTDAEDALDIAGDSMGESEFDEALEGAGAESVQPLGEIDQHGRTVAGDWHLWSLEVEAA